MMMVRRVVHVVLAAAMLWSGSGEAASMAAVKLCGRQLSEIMTRVCHAYNSPSWDVPTGKLHLNMISNFYKTSRKNTLRNTKTDGCEWHGKKDSVKSKKALLLSVSSEFLGPANIKKLAWEVCDQQ